MSVNGIEGILVVCSRAHALFKSLLCIETAVAFHIGVNNDRHSMITDHTPCIVGIQRPFGKDSTLICNKHDRIDKLSVKFWIRDRLQRMKRPESIPKREYCIDRFCHIPLMNIAIGT